MSPVSRRWLAISIAGLVLLLSAGCGKSAAPEHAAEGFASASIRIDGSSTVYPISMAIAEIYSEDHPDIKVPVRASGTSSGMKQFTVGEIDICDASRAMKEIEQETCTKHGIEYLELEIAFDGMAVVANPANNWCDAITVEQLKTIWRPESDGAVTKWSDVNPDWPAEPLKLYGPGTDSGTFEYFTEVICGESRASRPDYTASENDNYLVRGIEAEKGALGYFGYAYYAENKDRLKLLAVDNGSAQVLPNEETVRNGTYTPLSRPLFIYVSKKSLRRPEVASFVSFYLENAADMAREVGYVPVTEAIQTTSLQRLADALK